eukprot:scaffold25620_cov72-Phaeocystis_antarctica.AAC.1
MSTASDGAVATRMLAASQITRSARQMAPRRRPRPASRPATMVSESIDSVQPSCSSAKLTGETPNVLVKNRPTNLITSPPEHTRSRSYSRISQRTRVADAAVSTGGDRDCAASEASTSFSTGTVAPAWRMAS